MPPRIWMPNVPMILRLKAPPNVNAVMPPVRADFPDIARRRCLQQKREILLVAL
jgi:hypothetical protein